MGIPLVAGRNFTEHDHARGAEGCRDQPGRARKFFPNENPIGRRFGNSAETSSDIEIRRRDCATFATTAFASRPADALCSHTCSAGLMA
jgi:hypothetical protein